LTQQTRNPNELEWADLGDHVLWWINGIRGGIRLAWNNFRKNFVLYLIFIVLGLATSLGYLYQKSQTYIGKTTYRYSELHPQIFGNMVDKLNGLISSKDFDEFSSRISLPLSQARKIMKIEVTNSRGRDFSRIHAVSQVDMTVTVELSDTMDAEVLGQAVTRYFNNNPYTAARLDLKKQILNNEMEYIDGRVAMIDSILLAFQQKKGPSVSIPAIEDLGLADSYELLRFSKELIDRKSEISYHLLDPQNVISLDSMVILPEARFTPISAVLYGLVGIFVGVLIATAISIFLRFNGNP
jgi:hypothetical protein